MPFTKQLVKRVAGVDGRTPMNDEEHRDWIAFISGTMIGSGYECKDYVTDFLPFTEEFKPNWRKLYQRWLEKNRREWACFDVAGKLEFVTHDTQKVAESFDMPNEYVLQ